MDEPKEGTRFSLFFTFRCEGGFVDRVLSTDVCEGAKLWYVEAHQGLPPVRFYAWLLRDDAGFFHELATNSLLYFRPQDYKHQ